MENIRCLDQGQKSLDALSGAEADSQPQGGSPQKAELGYSRGQEAGSPGSWLRVRLLCNGNAIPNRIKLGRQKQSYSAE